MSRLVSTSLLYLVALASFAMAQAENCPKTDAQLAELISSIQSTPVSKLDSKLPSVRLADWLQEQGGPEAKLAWSGRCSSQPDVVYPAQVEVIATLNDKQTYYVSIGLRGHQSRPIFDTGWVTISKHESIELERLSDLPPVMTKLRASKQNSNLPEAQR